MSHNYTKRIENRIKLIKGTYVLSTHRIFVPNKGSKVFFRQVEVDPINSIVTICGTPPALKHIKEIYDVAMSKYFKTMHGYKHLKKKLNRHYRAKTA